MRSTSPVLYLPVEDRAREFDAKLLVAAAAAERGMIAIIGQQSFLTQLLAAVVPGVYLVKGLNRVQKRIVDAGASAGHAMVAIDEEAMGVADGAYMAMDVDPDIADGLSLALAQGEVQAEMLRSRRGVPEERIVVVGNPRLDLLRPPLDTGIEAEAEALRQRHGRFVLVNTNNAATNCVWGDLDAYRRLCVGIGWLTPGVPEQEAIWDSHVADDRRAASEIRGAIDLLSARLPNHRVIVRPHPSERFETWAERFAGSNRVQVLRDGSHLPWIRAADLVVHTSCTTGLEAELMGRRAISIVPAGARTAHWYLSNIACLTVPSAEAAAAMAVRHLDGGADPFAETADARRTALAGHLAPAGCGFAFDRIAERLAALMPGRGTIDRHWTWPDLLVRRPRAASRQQVGKMSLTADEARARLDHHGRVLGRFEGLDLLPVADSVVCVVGRRRLVVHGNRFFRYRDPS